MVVDYTVLRLRQNENRLECELTDPKSMQIIGLHQKDAWLNKSLKKRHGTKQKLDTLINEEAYLFAKFLRHEREMWVPRIVSCE